jgi:hypothetical protein
LGFGFRRRRGVLGGLRLSISHGMARLVSILQQPSGDQTRSQPQKVKMRPFFPEELLERVRVADLSATDERLPYPPFYSRVRAGGSRLVPDAAHVTSTPFIDVVAFNPSLREET